MNAAFSHVTQETFQLRQSSAMSTSPEISAMASARVKFVGRPRLTAINSRIAFATSRVSLACLILAQGDPSLVLWEPALASFASAKTAPVKWRVQKQRQPKSRIGCARLTGQQPFSPVHVFQHRTGVDCFGTCLSAILARRRNRRSNPGPISLLCQLRLQRVHFEW